MTSQQKAELKDLVEAMGHLAEVLPMVVRTCFLIQERLEKLQSAIEKEGT